MLARVFVPCAGSRQRLPLFSFFPFFSFFFSHYRMTPIVNRILPPDSTRTRESHALDNLNYESGQESLFLRNDTLGLPNIPQLTTKYVCFSRSV